MVDLILTVLVIGIIGGAGGWVYRAKKRGATCIGCPHAGQCGGKCGSHDGPH